jgi:(4S)-4-hydroxy-5-phosphonooxypentane-2,3-dione isomerase
MVCLTVRFVVVTGAMAKFLPLMRKQAETSAAAEPGCLRFEVWTDPDRPDQVWLHEVYADRAALEAHLQSDHFHAFDAAVTPMVAAKAVEMWTRAEAGASAGRTTAAEG